MRNIKSFVVVIAILIALSIGCFRSNDGSRLDFAENTNTKTNTEYVKTEYEIQQEKDAKRKIWVEDKLSTFTTLPKTSRLTKKPYLNGLAVAYHLPAESKEYYSDDAFIPTDKKAYEDSEVGTVIIIKDKSEWIGDYVVPGHEPIPGYIVSKEVIIVDQSIPAIIYRKSFRGEKPPKEKMLKLTDVTVEGEPPDEKVRDFLNNLPTKSL